MNREKMNAKELASVFNVNEKTIKKMAETEQIPYFYQKKRVYFDFYQVIRHFKFLEESNKKLEEDAV